MSSGRYLLSLKQDRKKVLALTLTEAADLSCQRGGTHVTLYEYLDEDHYYVPFTDSDYYCQSKEPPSQAFIQEVLDGVFRNLYILVGSQSPENADFKMATRHGLVVEKGVYKLSFRCYLFGFKIKLRDMRDLIVSKGLDKNGLGSFDKAPYNKSQLLGCVGFAKSESDTRLLVPSIGSCTEPGILEGFMVQNLTGDEPTLINDDENIQNETDISEPEDISEDVSSWEDSSPRFCPPWNLLEKCVMSLSIERRCEEGTYHEWTRIGWALAGIARAAKRSNDGLELWLRFCKQSSAYYENSCAAITVFSRASNHGRQLGWTSLMEALKEDAPNVHTDIESELCPNLEDLDATKMVKQFVKTSFGRPVRQIDRIVVRNYGSGKYFIVVLKRDSGCNLIDDDHEDGTQNYIVIGLKSARNKCAHPSCKAREVVPIPFAQYPEEIKSAVLRHLQISRTPKDIVQSFVRQHKESNFTDLDDDDLQIGDPQPGLFGVRYPLLKNPYCFVCRCKHDRPENCMIVNQTATQLAMGCRLNPYDFHPPGGIVVPQNITNIIVNQTVHVAEPQQLEDEVFDEVFALYPDEILNRLVNSSLKGFASDIARVFVHLGRDRFGVQTGDGNTWWAWDDVEKRWMQSQHKANIFCDEVLAPVYVGVMQWLRKNTPDSDKRTRRLQKVEQLLKRLKDRDQYTILAQAAILLKEEKRNFEFMLDSNKDILNFQGQIFDFEKLEIRHVHPSDHVSLTTGYGLPEVDIGKRTKVMEILASIMPDKEHLDYLLLHLAGCLDGWNREEIFHILTGTGRNGKGILSLLMEHALGKTCGYFKDVKAELLTKDRPSADRPAPELLNTNGKRLIVASEPESGSRINTGFLKFLTGNDPISGRWLHGNTEISFSPQHSLWLLCNSIPSLDAHDEAVWDRSRVLEFPFHFVDKPTCESEKKIDRTLKRTIPKLAPQLMVVLLEAYGKYKREGLTPTPKMISCTETVRDANDVYGLYIEEMLEITLSNDDRLLKKEVEGKCTEWIKKQYGSNIFNKTALENALTKLSVVKKVSTRIPGCKGTPQGYVGVRFRDCESSDEIAFLPD